MAKLRDILAWSSKTEQLSPDAALRVASSVASLVVLAHFIRVGAGVATAISNAFEPTTLCCLVGGSFSRCRKSYEALRAVVKAMRSMFVVLSEPWH